VAYRNNKLQRLMQRATYMHQFGGVSMFSSFRSPELSQSI
jgi:hypothetical protein